MSKNSAFGDLISMLTYCSMLFIYITLYFVKCLNSKFFGLEIFFIFVSVILTGLSQTEANEL